MICLLLVAMVFPVAGCATLGGGGGNWQNNIPQLKADIFMFSKIATRVALSEANMQSGDIEVIEGYLVALRDLLAVPGVPNFNGAKALVGTKLPRKYQIYGLTVIDLLDRYLQTANLNIDEDQEAIITIISSGIDGALETVLEFAGE